MRTKNHRTRKHHSRKRKQHRSRMIRRKSRAYGRMKMFGGAWVRKDRLPIDIRDVGMIDDILSRYKAGDTSQLGIEHPCRKANDPKNTVVLSLPSKRVIKFDWTPAPHAHANTLNNVKYIGTDNTHDLVEFVPPSFSHTSNESGKRDYTKDGPRE